MPPYSPYTFKVYSSICLENVDAFIKKYFIAKRCYHRLSLQWVIIFLLVEGLRYCENDQNVTQRHEVSKCCWESSANRLAQCTQGCHKPSICFLFFLKKKKKKWYLQSAIKWSMPIDDFVEKDLWTETILGLNPISTNYWLHD